MRNRHVTITVSCEEHAVIERRATARGQSINAYVRSLLKLPPREDGRKSLDRGKLVQ